MSQHVISISATNVYDPETRRTELGYRFSCSCGARRRIAWLDRKQAEAFGQAHLDFSSALDSMTALAAQARPDWPQEARTASEGRKVTTDSGEAE